MRTNDGTQTSAMIFYDDSGDFVKKREDSKNFGTYKSIPQQILYKNHRIKSWQMARKHVLLTFRRKNFKKNMKIQFLPKKLFNT